MRQNTNKKIKYEKIIIINKILNTINAFFKSTPDFRSGSEIDDLRHYILNER